MDPLNQMMLLAAARRRGFDPDTPIGTFIRGGYFAGSISQGGQQWAILVAPRASGQSSSGLLYRNQNSPGPFATRTLNNGPAATAAMVAAGSAADYPAAHFCANLTINGLSDWYLPARDELELCFRNFKPSFGSVSTATRFLSTYTYPEFTDQSGDTMGVNRSSVPQGAAYVNFFSPPSQFSGPQFVGSDPPQTSVTDFQGGGPEAFSGTFYWSSSESASGDAWRQALSNGAQLSSVKPTSQLVRAVRRVPI